jgi:hypothetical protein
MFQCMIARLRSIAPGDEHNPKALSQVMLMVAYDFPQTASDTIANYRASKMPRSDKAHPRGAGSLDCCHTKHEQLAPPRQVISFHAFVFRGAR